MAGGETSRGFTLLEVLVAFTLCAFVLAAALQLFSGGLRSTTVSQRHVIATMLAESKLAELESESPPVIGREVGSTPDGYRWQAEVTEYYEPNAIDLNNSPIVLYQMTVAVAWGEEGRDRGITLTTLRVGSAPDTNGGEAASQ